MLWNEDIPENVESLKARFAILGWKHDWIGWSYSFSTCWTARTRNFERTDGRAKKCENSYSIQGFVAIWKGQILFFSFTQLRKSFSEFFFSWNVLCNCSQTAFTNSSKVFFILKRRPKRVFFLKFFFWFPNWFWQKLWNTFFANRSPSVFLRARFFCTKKFVQRESWKFCGTVSEVPPTNDLKVFETYGVEKCHLLMFLSNATNLVTFFFFALSRFLWKVSCGLLR